MGYRLVSLPPVQCMLVILSIAKRRKYLLSIRHVDWALTVYISHIIVSLHTVLFILYVHAHSNFKVYTRTVHTLMHTKCGTSVADELGGGVQGVKDKQGLWHKGTSGLLGVHGELETSHVGQHDF